MKPADDRLRGVFNTVEPFIERRYGALPFRSFRGDGQPRVRPFPIPGCRPTQWVSWWQGAVV